MAPPPPYFPTLVLFLGFSWGRVPGPTKLLDSFHEYLRILLYYINSPISTASRNYIQK